MRIFTTGATGFIGGHFVNAALGAGHQVLALRRPGSRPRVDLEQEPVWVEGQLGEIEGSAFEGCDVFVHHAAHGVSPQTSTWRDALYWNVERSLAQWQTALTAGVRRFLISGSSAEYGGSANRYDHIPPNASLEPVGAYAASKAAAGIAASALARESNMELTYLRIFSAFGYGQYEGNLWPALRSKAAAGEDFPMTAGEQIRDFIPVERVAERFVEELAFYGVSPGRPKIANVGGGQPQTALDFASHWWRTWHAKGRLRPGEVPYSENEIMRLVPKL